MDIREVFWGDNKRKILTIFTFMVLILIIVALILTFNNKTSCTDYSCFQKAMSSCDKADYINQDSLASWGYTILGERDGECSVRVKLLDAKEGDLGIEKFVGMSMDCSYSLGVVAYPEKKLDNCHGRLKEELQGVVIEKLYKYIISNLGQVSESIKNAV